MGLALLLAELHLLCTQPGPFCEHPDVILLWQTRNMGTQHSHLPSGGSMAPCRAPWGPHCIHSNSFTGWGGGGVQVLAGVKNMLIPLISNTGKTAAEERS